MAAQRSESNTDKSNFSISGRAKGTLLIVSPRFPFQSRTEEHRVQTGTSAASLHRPFQEQIRLANDRLSLIESACSRWPLLSRFLSASLAFVFAGNVRSAAPRSIGNDPRRSGPDKKIFVSDSVSFFRATLSPPPYSPFLAPDTIGD